MAMCPKRDLISKAAIGCIMITVDNRTVTLINVSSMSSFLAISFPNAVTELVEVHLLINELRFDRLNDRFEVAFCYSLNYFVELTLITISR